MPYKDPVRRRQFQREYKRQWRQRRGKIHPLQGFKIYICPRFPRLTVGLAYFDAGFLITDNADVQAQVERHPEFGWHIFALALDLSGPTMENDNE